VRRQFAQLSEQAKPFDPTDRTQLRSRLYHADMLTMDGRFRQAAALLEDASEAVGYRELVNWGELTRHLGHVYRFSFMLEEAVDLYELALARSGEAPGMIAKLHTNLAEAYCWFQPELALERAEVSLEMHRRGGNEIELCKCQAARAVALARLRQFAKADQAIVDSKRLGRAAGYPAGVAFAMQAEAVRRGRPGERPGSGHAIGRLRRKVKEIGTYGHLMVAPLALRDKGEFEAARARYEWLDPERLSDRLRGYLGL
jgi:tetratricopeptide (TPR) repeat protein